MPSLDVQAVAEFAAGASGARPIAVVSPIERGPEPEPDERADRDAKPTNGINLRLNDYELELVRSVAEKQDRSIQKTIKRILIPALEQELQR